jgi:hypothetical protein
MNQVYLINAGIGIVFGLLMMIFPKIFARLAIVQLPSKKSHKGRPYNNFLTYFGEQSGSRIIFFSGLFLFILGIIFLIFNFIFG